MRRGRARECEREPEEPGIAWYMLDDDGFVLPEFRTHVAALRKPPVMCHIEEVARVALSQSKDAEE